MDRIDRLIQDLEHPDFTRRADAAAALHRHRYERVVSALARVLEHDPAEAPRAMAAFSLSRMRGPGVLPALAPGVRDRSLHVRETVASGLARCDDEGAVPLLCDALRFAMERAAGV